MIYFIALMLLVFLVVICIIVDTGLKRISNKLASRFQAKLDIYNHVNHSFPPHPLNDIHWTTKTDKIRKSLAAIEEHLFSISESLKKAAK